MGVNPKPSISSWLPLLSSDANTPSSSLSISDFSLNIIFPIDRDDKKFSPDLSRKLSSHCSILSIVFLLMLYLLFDRRGLVIHYNLY